MRSRCVWCQASQYWRFFISEGIPSSSLVCHSWKPTKRNPRVIRCFCGWKPTKTVLCVGIEIVNLAQEIYSKRFEMAWSLISLPHRMRSIAEVSTLVVCLYLQISAMNSFAVIYSLKHAGWTLSQPSSIVQVSVWGPHRGHSRCCLQGFEVHKGYNKWLCVAWGKSCMLMVLKSHQAVSKLPGLPPLLMMLQLQFTLIILQIHISCKHESLWCAYKCAQHTSNNRNLATLVASYWRNLFFLVLFKHVPITVIQALFKDTCVIIELSRVLVTSAELWTVHAANKGGVALSAAQWKRLGKQVKILST